jgi:hypothetical protein
VPGVRPVIVEVVAADPVVVQVVQEDADDSL